MSDNVNMRLKLALGTKWNIDAFSWGRGKFANRDLVVLPTVFPGEYFTPFLADEMVRVATETVAHLGHCHALEMGAGTGAAILTVGEVPGVTAVAIDVNPMAALNVSANALHWGIKCRSLAGDVFAPLDVDEKFDLVFWHIPFMDLDPGEISDPRYTAGFDPGYAALKRFLDAIVGRLAPGGRAFLGLDRTLCDFAAVEKLARSRGLTFDVRAESKTQRGNLEISFTVTQIV
jgi:methylase of polypeptide subunit release factors